MGFWWLCTFECLQEYSVLRFDDGEFSEILMIANLGEEVLQVLDFFSTYGDWGFGWWMIGLVKVENFVSFVEGSVM